MAATAQDSLRPVKIRNDLGNERGGTAVETIECLAIRIEWEIHHHLRRIKFPPLTNVEPERKMDRTNQRPTSERLDILSKGFDLLKAKMRSLISHAKKTLDKQIERIAIVQLI